MGVQRLYLRGNRIAIFTRKGVFLNSCKQSFIPGKKTAERQKDCESGRGEKTESLLNYIPAAGKRTRSRWTFIAVGLDRFA